MLIFAEIVERGDLSMDEDAVSEDWLEQFEDDDDVDVEDLIIGGAE